MSFDEAIQRLTRTVLRLRRRAKPLDPPLHLGHQSGKALGVRNLPRIEPVVKLVQVVAQVANAYVVERSVQSALTLY